MSRLRQNVPSQMLNPRTGWESPAHGWPSSATSHAGLIHEAMTANIMQACAAYSVE